MSGKRLVIFANGHLPDLEAARALLRPGDFLLAADGGTRHALAMGLMPSAIIGDLDSLTEDERRRTEAAGVQLLEHPRDKDETDLELALRFTFHAGYRSILVLAALGERLDQTLGNLVLLTDPAWRALDIRMDDGIEEVFFIRASAEIHGQPGDTVSLLPWGSPAEGVVAAGLRWPLRGETLYPHKTRGVSNEMLGNAASISIKSGLLLCVHRRNS